MSFNPAEELKDFPCNFNLVNANRSSHQRLMSVKDNIEADLDRGDYLPEETLRNLNLLTWVMFRLNENDEALRLNKEALKMTKRKSITSLGNLIFITAHLEYRMETTLKYLKELQDLKSHESFDSLLTEALAEQAYSYSRLGNANNYKLCCELYERCTEKCPENYLWKYGLGLAYRRLTGYNLRCSDSHKLDPTELTEKCTSILFEVAWDGDIYLKGLAYAQLASLRQYIFQREQDDLFNFLNIQQLVRKAVRYGSRNPAVLTQCGKSLKIESIDWSIDLLRRSLQLRENSIAFHHLGLCLLRKHFRVKDEGFLRSKSNLAPYGMGSLRLFSSFPTRSSLDKENELVKEAKFRFEKSLEVCHGENKPARLSLGSILLKSGQIKDALVEFNKIIDSNERSHFPTVVSAHELAGECLLQLSDLTEDNASKESLKKEAVEQFTKALSLAADFASRNPEYKKCEIEVWNSFKRLNEDIKQLPSTEDKLKQNIQLLELTQNENIVNVTKKMFHQGLELEDFDIFLKRLNSLLKKGSCEEALAFLNVASAHSAMTNNDHWFSSQGIKARLSTYIGAAWTRLLKDSVDSRRMFQLMFKLKFGQCAGMISDEEGEESETVKQDVLVVHDDKGKEPNHTTILARNLALVCNVTFGLDTYINLEGNGNCGIQYEESLLKETERHCLVLFIVGENDSNEYDSMLKAAHKVRGENILVINCRQHASCPSFLERNKCLIFSDSPWQQSKLMGTTVGQQTAMISDQKNFITSDQQTLTSSDQKREKICIKHTDISSDQQIVRKSDQQPVISSDQLTVASSDQQTVITSDQQTLTSSDQQREKICIKHADIRSDQQTVIKSDQQPVISSDQQTLTSSDQQTLTSSDQQREKISIKQTDISSAQYNEITIVKPNEISIIQQTETRGTNQNDISTIQNSEINSRLGVLASVSDQNSAVTPGMVNSNQQCDINFTQHNDIDCTYLTKAQAMSNKYVIDKFFDGNKEILMELFCFLIDESFDLHRECFPFMLKM